MKKLSEVLLEFARPLLGDSPTRQHFHVVMDQLVMLWNLALLPEEKQKELWIQIEGAIETSSAGSRGPRVSARTPGLVALAQIPLRH